MPWRNSGLMHSVAVAVLVLVAGPPRATLAHGRYSTVSSLAFSFPSFRSFSSEDPSPPHSSRADTLSRRQKAPSFRTHLPNHFRCVRTKADTDVVRRRMQMGLVVGFFMNVMFGMWRYLWGTF